MNVQCYCCGIPSDRVEWFEVLGHWFNHDHLNDVERELVDAYQKEYLDDAV